ncbi:nucleoside hydrolase [Tessaracoccus oleiagri]|uniref:Purine nucleosidase n=1 Tax=Tessaracoccus oleiagri TaxID=686624 RepID=A0A1G9I6C1_9ACTN|nr:nucleoside hydrolase [Tessaracoccus oleiagri]SDL20771.1 purine nucleosidase [Tessaracoccus oleiagri]
MRIILDTDPGVDDAIALLFALRHPGITLDAVTTVAGNVELEHTTRNALGILQLAGATDVPVHVGSGRRFSELGSRASDAHGDTGLGGVSLPIDAIAPSGDHAAQFIVDHTAAHPGEVTLLAVGPLGNVAEALEIDPTLPARVPELMIMGGAEGTGNITPSAEFNFWHDPGAAKVVFEAGFAKISMVGLDATGQVFMSPGARELLRHIDDPLAKFMFDITEQYADFYWQRRRLVGAELCDALAAMALVDRDITGWVDAHVEICDEGLCAGRSVVARTERYRDRTANAAVATTVRTQEFFEVLLTTLFPAYTTDIQRVLQHEYRP